MKKKPTSAAWIRYQEALAVSIAKRMELEKNRDQFIAMLKQGKEAKLTNVALGKIFNISAERVRQYLLKAEKKKS